MAYLQKEKLFDFSFEEYKNFKNLLIKTIKEFLNFKNQKYENELEDLFKLEEKKELLLEYLYFINYKEFLNINFEYNIHNKNEAFIRQLKKFKLYTNKSIFNRKIFKSIFNIFLCLIINIENEIKNISNNDNEYSIGNEIKNINKNYYLIYEIFFLIIKVYIEKIYDLKHIILFADILCFFIDKKDNINDKYFRLKKMIFLELLFNFFEKIITILLKDNGIKEDILYFFNYLTKYFGNYNLKSISYNSILANNKIIENFLLTMLNNINYSSPMHKDIYKICHVGIIESLANIYQKNINISNFFNILINQNKESFINLSNIVKNKENVIKDIYIQNFYIELLNKLFENEKILNNKNIDNNKIIPPKNSFIFNGYNSKMTIKLNKFYLDNSLLLFSFQLSSHIINKNCDFPLFTFENEFNKKILFKLYIKHTIDNNSNKSRNKLYICQEEKKEIILDNIDDISLYTNYYIALFFKNKKVNIFVRSVNNSKEIKNQQEIEISNIKELQMNLKIGHNDNENGYFQGYIGSIISIRNLSYEKGINFSDIIFSLLKLREFYKYFPYFFSKTTNYNFENILSYYKSSNENLFINIRNHLKKYIKDFECLLYLTPEIISLYNSLKDKDIPFVYLPEVPDICENQKFYVILDMNISLVNFDSILINFLTNNGLDYICLIYEYYYQFSNLYVLNKNELKEDSIEPNLKRVITNTINKTILILQNYNKCKYIINFENSFKKMFKNLYECLKSLNVLWNILSQEIISNLHELAFSFKDDAIIHQENNFIEDFDLNNKVLPFCDGLIDILFDIELYKKYDEDNSIEILFLFVSSFLATYIKNNKENKFLPFRHNFFYKIINFTQLIEKLFTDDYKNKDKTISSLFILLEHYFIAIKDEKNSIKYFKHLLEFCLNNYENNLYIIYNFLSFIHEMLWKGYTLEDEDLSLLLNFSNNYYDEINKSDDIDKESKITNELFSVISCIIVDLIFNKDSTKIMNEVNKNIKIFANNQYVLTNTANEIRQIIEGLMQNNNSISKSNKYETKCYKDIISNYMNFYWNIFNFIIKLFKCLINVDNIPEEDYEKDNKQKKIYSIKNNVNFYNLYNLLVNIEEIIREKKNNVATINNNI